MNAPFRVAVLGLLSVSCTFGAAYKEGKTVLERNYKVDILKMNWGMRDKDTDRIIGTARLFETNLDSVYSAITLVFDVYSRDAVKNAPAPRISTGQETGDAAPPTTEKIDTIEITFDFRKYGYRKMRNYFEGDFCVDFSRNPKANRISLTNVKVSTLPVTYQTTFNISMSLLKTLFTLSEPKVIPLQR